MDNKESKGKSKKKNYVPKDVSGSAKWAAKESAPATSKNHGKRIIIEPSAYRALYANPVSLLTSSKKGLEAKAALDFLYLSGFTQEQFQDTFKTTVKTIQNYAGQNLRLDASLSEKILKSLSLFERGISLFGTAESFYGWLNVPAYGLGSQVPFELMDTITGISVIEEELIRLEYGDLS